MNKRIKKKIEKRYGYHSYKKSKLFMKILKELKSMPNDEIYRMMAPLNTIYLNGVRDSSYEPGTEYRGLIIK